MMFIRLWRRGRLALIWVTLTSTAVEAQPLLTPLPGFAYAVSDDGRVVAGRFGAPFHAYRWTAQDGVQDLGTLGGVYSEGLAINADGTAIAGWGRTVSEQDHAFRWTEAGGMQDLGSLGGRTIGRSISGSGDVVVGWSNPPDISRAFRWTESGGMQDIGTLGDGPFSSAGALDVNADGSVVVGVSDYQAFRWTEAGGMQSLGSGTSSTAIAVSRNGDAISGFTSEFVLGMFRWTSSDGMQEIQAGDLGPDVFRFSIDEFAMSGNGVVLGGSGRDLTVPINEHLYRAWLWTENSGMTLLEPYLASLGVDLTGWELGEVTDLSFDGSTIIGRGMFNGVATSWMVSGVPSPGGSSLITIGLVAASRRRRPVAY